MLVSLMMLLCFQVNHSVNFMENDTNMYIEFLKNKWNSSCAESRFYFHTRFHGKHRFTFMEKGRKEVYRIPEDHKD